MVEDAQAGLALVGGLIGRNGEVRKREHAINKGRGVALLISGGEEGVQHAFPLGLELIEGILAVGGGPTAGGGIHSAGAALGLDNKDVSIRALDDEVPFPPDAALILVGKPPTNGKTLALASQMHGGIAFALGAGIRR